MAYYVFLIIYLVFPRLGNHVSAKILGAPFSNASYLCFLLPSSSVLLSQPHTQLLVFTAQSMGLQPHLSASSAVSRCLTGRQ